MKWLVVVLIFLLIVGWSNKDCKIQQKNTYKICEIKTAGNCYLTEKYIIKDGCIYFSDKIICGAFSLKPDFETERVCKKENEQ